MIFLVWTNSPSNELVYQLTEAQRPVMPSGPAFSEASRSLEEASLGVLPGEKELLDAWDLWGIARSTFGDFQGSRRMSRVAFGGFGRFFSQTVLISTLKNRLNRYGSGGFWYLRPMNSHQPCLRKAYWACHPHTLTHGSDWRQRDATSMPTWAIPCNSQILAL